ncbi:MAG: acyltransferase family protein [Oscillospiraceae bacterium]|nr:acyltransferase family protein [Oscillospiraceae bacterium]
MEVQVSKPPVMPAGKPRFIGIDIVKILACMLVVCVHFFLYSGFYSEPITKDFGQGAIFCRWAAYCCVPLFMITTGYLMKNKTLSKKYYLGILRVLIVYVICSIICYAFDHQHWPMKYDVPYGGYSVWIFIRGLFMFTDAQYAWYVEYYICMFLIIPFVNLAFNNLKDKKQKQIMLITTLIITIVSQSFFVGFKDITQIRLFPGYFSRCYPIAYYLIGAYIRDYPPKRTLMNKFYFIVMFGLALAWVSNTTYNQSLMNEENNFVMLSKHYNDYGSWPVAVCSTMLFLIFFDIESRNKVLIQIVKFISEATFACYLVSYVFDSIYYGKFCPQYMTVAERCNHAYLVIPKVFFSAMGVALAIQAVYSGGDWLIRKQLIPAVGRANAADAGALDETAQSEEDAENAIEDEIEKLKMLYDEGILTEEEYKSQVKRMKQ